VVTSPLGKSGAGRRGKERRVEGGNSLVMNCGKYVAKQFHRNTGTIVHPSVATPSE